MDSSIGIKVIWNRLHTFIVKKADILKQIDQINKKNDNQIEKRRHQEIINHYPEIEFNIITPPPEIS